MVKLDKEVTLVVDAGSCKDIVDQVAGFDRLEATFRPGLVLPMIDLQFIVTRPEQLKCLLQGTTVTLIFGVESGNIVVEGTILKTLVEEPSDSMQVRTFIILGIDFGNEFLSWYKNGTSLNALSDLLGRYYHVRNEATTPSDSMSWMGYGVARHLAMNVWMRSYYGGSNFLLPGIDYRGAILTDLATATSAAKWKLGSEAGDDAQIEQITIVNRRPLAQDGLDKDVVYDELVSSYNPKLLKPDPKPFIVSQVHAWRVGRRRVREWQYDKDGPVHENWSNALAYNTGYFSILGKQVTISYRGFLPVEMFDAVDLDVPDARPEPYIGGRFIVGDISFVAEKGEFRTYLGLMREEVAL